VAVEALLRWNHPLEGFIPPDEFIGVAEQCGAIDRITDWVIEHSLSAVSGFRKFVPDLRVAVNVSANEFSSHNDLYNRVSQALARSGLPSDALELELTETALLSHPEHASDLIRKLSDAGIQIAIDDFGTGYASMSHLIQLPINTIKIDRSFVDGLECDARKQSVVKGILAIANGMDLYSVGEGVETAEQFDCLNKYGCLSAQGYLLSKPVPEDEVCNVLMSLDGQIEAA
jgi:EAL domain-containing protein (putative c-di-GMP-specific phosphodiesterase class I)